MTGRVVHLLALAREPLACAERSSGVGAARACAGAMLREPGAEHHAVFLGAPADARRHASILPAGVGLWRVTPPAGVDAAAAWAVRRAVMRIARGGVTKGGAGGVGAVGARGVRIQPWDERARRMAALAGLRPAAVVDTPLLAVRAQREWMASEGGGGVGGDRPAPPMVALLADPAPLGDARAFVFMMGLLDVMEDPTVGVMSAASARAEAARRFHASAPVGWPLRVSHAPIGLSWAGVRVAVVLEARGARLGFSHCAAVASAHAAGVPVVWRSARAHPALYPACPGIDALVPRSSTLRDAAGCVLALLERPDELREWSGRVRSHVMGGADLVARSGAGPGAGQDGDPDGGLDGSRRGAMMPA